MIQNFQKNLQVSLIHRTNFFPKILQVPPFSQHQIHKKLQVFANHEKQKFSQNFWKIVEKLYKFHSFTPPKFFPNTLQISPLSQNQILKKITSLCQPRETKFSKNFTSFRKGYLKKAMPGL